MYCTTINVFIQHCCTSCFLGLWYSSSLTNGSDCAEQTLFICFQTWLIGKIVIPISLQWQVGLQRGRDFPVNFWKLSKSLWKCKKNNPRKVLKKSLNVYKYSGNFQEIFHPFATPNGKPFANLADITTISCLIFIQFTHLSDTFW